MQKENFLIYTRNLGRIYNLLESKELGGENISEKSQGNEISGFRKDQDVYLLKNGITVITEGLSTHDMDFYETLTRLNVEMRYRSEDKEEAKKIKMKIKKAAA